MSRRPRRQGLLSARTWLLVGALVLVAVGAWTAWAARSAHADLVAARSDLAGASDVRSVQELQVRVDRARARTARAAARLGQPGPWLAGHVPVLGRSIAAGSAVARSADAVLLTAHRVLPIAAHVDNGGGSVDVDRLRDLSRELRAGAERTAGPLRDLRDVPLGLVPESVRRPVEEARQQLGGGDDDLRKAAQASDALAGLLGGNGQRHLVLAIMNNAELRGAGGYASSFAEVVTDGGHVDVRPFQDVNDVFDAPDKAHKVPAPADFSARYGRYLADTTLLKNALMSADVPTSASVLCSALRARPGIPCDGVVLVDVPTLAALTTVTGPAHLDNGEEVSGEALVKALLVDAYADVDTTPGGDVGRRAALRRAADGGIERLLGGDVASPATLRALLSAVRGRHVAVWSAREGEQAELTAAGLSAATDPHGDDECLVVMNQFGESKLDYYADRAVAVRVVLSDTSAEVEQKVTLGLQAPPGLHHIVEGVGRLVGVLDIATAADAELEAVERDGHPEPFSREREAGTLRVVVTPDIANGASTTWTVRYRVPLSDGHYRLRMLPQPLARDATLRLDVRAVDGLKIDSVSGPVHYDGPFDATTTVDVGVQQHRPPWWDRVLGG